MDVHKQFAKFFNDEELYPYAYLLSKKLSEGHICIDVNRFDNNDIAELDLEDKEINIEIALKSKFVTKAKNELKPFIFYNNNLYIRRYFNYESKIINKIKELIKQETIKDTKTDVFKDRVNFLLAKKEFLKKLYSDIKENATNDENIDWQFVGTVLSYLHNFSIITGGPGTGKTTTVAKILALLYKENSDLKVALTAPTGKAAMRMKEALKNNPLIAKFGIDDKVAKLQEFTIHRLLGYKHNSPYFKHNEDNYLNYDVVIVDEASMIDVALFYKLISAVSPESRIILLGDKNQLSSVEAGSLLADLCNSQKKLNSISEAKYELINGLIDNSEKKIPVEYKESSKQGDLFEHITELRFSHRFDDNSSIGRLSKAVLQMNEEETLNILKSTDSDNIVLDNKFDDSIFNDFINEYKEYINEEDKKIALKKLNKLRVLCVVRQGERGVYAVNEKIEKYLRSNGLISLNDDFYINRPIMITKNYNELKLYNGDIGIVRLDESDNNIKVFFLDNENNLKPISPGLIAESETVFAMTVHKSQGSEYDNVLVLMPNNKENPLLTRELLYTGITRAKTKLVIQGSEDIILTSVKNKVDRASGITNRIN